MIVYFTSVSGNTKRLVDNLRLHAVQIPLRPRLEQMPVLDEHKVLIVPTYGAGPATKAVPKQVVQFLNIKENRDNIVGVIGTGNKNFGEAYCLAADIVAQKLQVPVLYKLEIFGTPDDHKRLQEGIPKYLESRR